MDDGPETTDAAPVDPPAGATTAVAEPTAPAETAGDAGTPRDAQAGRGGERSESAAVGLLRRLTEANVLVVTVCALVIALVLGGLLICVTTPAVLQAWGKIFSHPGHAIAVTWDTVTGAYVALLEGAIFNPHAHGATAAFNPISETLVSATPLILAGLGVALGFSTGVFNIGGQGQLIAGALGALYVGFQVHAPIGIHLPLVILGGAAGGAIVGFIPGYLKARTGAHEVITTIMLNYIMLDLLSYLLSVSPFQQPGQNNSISKPMPSTAIMPHLFGSTLRANLGLLVALAAAAGVAWLANRSRLGFSFKVIGLNPDAGRTAGMDVRRVTVLVMAISGALVGLAGMATLSGTDFFLSTNYGGNTGFDAITVALLGRNRPIGVVLGSLLFATLITGARNMQAVTGIPTDLSTVIQALMVFCVATPALVREIFRLREARGGQLAISTKGWSG
jgi:ABC-type uncharacterized transport system permease subunit